MHHFGFRFFSSCMIVALATGCGSGSGSANGSGQLTSGSEAPPKIQQPASSPPQNQQAATVHSVLAPDEQTLQHVRDALATEPELFDTSQKIDARSFDLVGDGIADETPTFRALLAGGNRTVVVPAGEYSVAQLHVEAGTVLILEPGVMLRDAGRVPAHQALIEIAADNVRIVGPGARIVGATAAYSDGPRDGIAVRGASNVLIEGLESSGHSGSGFMIGATSAAPATNVVLRGCQADDNLRSGLAVVSARRVRIVECAFGSTTVGAQRLGMYFERESAAQVLDDIVAARAHTQDNVDGGIMIDVQDTSPVTEPTTIAIIDHWSAREADPLLATLAGEAPTDVRYSGAREQTPRQTWQALRGAAGGIVLSYYWPVPEKQQGFYTLAMASPNVIDILPSQGHGTSDVRSYWTRRGKVLLSRVYPFRVPRTEQQMYDYFADAMRGATGLAVDEVIAHTLDRAQRSALQGALTRIRAQFPDKLIVVWDASRWEDGTQDLLQAIGELADAIVLETYVSQLEARNAGWARFTRTLQAVESRAPGIRGKIVLGIGAYDDMRELGGDFAAHLERQVRYLARSQELCGTAGLGIYAPVYLTADEQRRLDAAIRTEFLTSALRASCAANGTE